MKIAPEYVKIEHIVPLIDSQRWYSIYVQLCICIYYKTRLPAIKYASITKPYIIHRAPEYHPAQGPVPSKHALGPWLKAWSESKVRSISRPRQSPTLFMLFSVPFILHNFFFLARASFLITPSLICSRDEAESRLVLREHYTHITLHLSL